MEKKTELMALMLQGSSAWPEGRFYLLVLQPSDIGYSKKKMTHLFIITFYFVSSWGCVWTCICYRVCKCNLRQLNLPKLLLSLYAACQQQL